MTKLVLYSIILFAITVNSFHYFGQFASYQMKELFDLAHSHSYQKRTSHKPLAKYFMNGLPNSLVNFRINTAPYYETETNLGTYRATALESILRMYEYTNDKIYLYEAMLEINDIMESRLDRIPNSGFTSPKWFPFRSDFEFDFRGENNWGSSSFTGRIVLPLAHFVHIIYRQNNLYNSPLNLPSYTSFSTFGAYADWLKARLDESMEYIYQFLTIPDLSPLTLDYYPYFDEDNVFEGFRWGDTHYPTEANFQSPFGSAMVYYYLLNNDLLTAELLAGLVHNFYTKTYSTEYLPCNGSDDFIGTSDITICDYFPSSDYPNCSTNGIFLYNTLLNSYVFAHNGWKFEGSKKPLYVEDIGHGTLTFRFADIYNKYYTALNPGITANAYFDDANLLRFRNTFVKQMYNQDPNEIKFHTGIDGTDDKDYYSCNLNQSPFNNSSNALNYMFLHRFDNMTGDEYDVYDILMTYLINDLKVDNTLDNDETKFYGSNMVGLADMVGAWMQKENYSLHYSDRKLFFNQNFYAKDKLIFKPKESQFTSFPDLTMNPWPLNEQFSATPTASQTILANNSFIIESGVTSKICAGSEVILGDGFEVLAGADVSINAGNGCINETDKKLESSNHLPKVRPLTEIYKQLDENRKKHEAITQESNNIKEIEQAILLPNPNDGSFKVLVPNDYLSGTFKIYDIYGKLCFEQTIESSIINLYSNLSSGVYLFVVENQKLRYQDRLVVK